MSKEYIEAFRDILGILSAVSGCEVDMNSERIITVKSALQRLESIDNANPSEALECSLKLYKMVESAGNGNGFSLNEAWKYHNTIKQYILKVQKEDKIISGIEDYLNQRIKVEPIEDVKKAFIEIRNQLQVIKEVLE